MKERRSRTNLGTKNMSSCLKTNSITKVNTKSSTVILTQVLLQLFLIIQIVTGFNVDTSKPVIHRGPVGSYFGYVVAQHKDGRAPWLLVGAPLAPTPQSMVEKGGAVYKCSPDTSQACQQIPFDVTGSGMINIRGKMEQVDEKSNQWFGSTVHSSRGKAGMIVACAPRYVYYSTNRKRRDPVGTCYLSRGSFSGFLEYSPCRTPNWGYHRQGSCQAGFSAALTEDGERLFVGAPGSWYWQGQVFSQDLMATPSLPNDTSVPISTRESPESNDDSYLGYSMTTGHFSSRYKPSTSHKVAEGTPFDVAVGMPKGSNLTGKVVIYTEALENLFNITGEQMGSYFGHSLAAADVNGDGLDDIIIGAPLFMTLNTKDKSYEKGRVYVAYQDTNYHNGFEIRTRIDGTRSKSRFGASIASLGDINKDGYMDIAVGAPYDGEREAGAVYIFNGARNGLKSEPSQIIYAEEMFEPGLKTFGYSLSGGLDLDSNEYPDLLVGAYDSDRAISLRGRPVVNVSASLKVDPENINLEDKTCTLSDNTTAPCITVTLCLQHTGIGVDWELNFTYDLKLDMGTNRPPRMFLLYKEGQTSDQVLVTLKKDTKFCRSIYAYLSSKLRDKLTPIKVDLEYQLFENPYQISGRNQQLRPILNQNQSNKLSKQVHIEKNCGKDNKCIPDLKLSVKSNMDQYLIGSRKRLELDITVKNAGEDAFEAMLYLFMPLEVNYVNINKTKRDDSVICTGAQPEKTGLNVLICDIGNPLAANKRINFGVILEPSSMTTAVPDFTFIVNVNSSNPEEGMDTENNEAVIGLPIRVEVNMTTTGTSQPEMIIQNISEPIITAKSSELDIGPQVVHLYQLQNRGPSTIRKALVTILWPSTTPDGQYLLYLLDQPKISGKGSCQTITLDEVNPLRLPLAKSDRMPMSNNVILGDDPHQLLSHHESVLDRMRRTPKDGEEEEGEEMKRRNVTGSVTFVPRKEKRFYRPIQEARNPGSGEHLLHEDPSLAQYMSCGPRICTKIYCTVSNLNKGESVLFSVRSRLWSETVAEIGTTFAISSKMVSVVSRLPYDVDPGYLTPQIAIVTTDVHLTGVDKPAPIPLWIILLAVVGGLLLLSLLVLAFYKCGFFKRKRPPIVESESVEPLHSPSSRNGHYHYNKGDTSL